MAAGGDEPLDGVGRRLRVGRRAAGQREAALGALLAGEERRRAGRGRRGRPAATSAWTAEAVSSIPLAPRPPTLKPPSSFWWRSIQRAAVLIVADERLTPERRSARIANDV